MCSLFRRAEALPATHAGTMADPFHLDNRGTPQHINLAMSEPICESQVESMNAALSDPPALAPQADTPVQRSFHNPSEMLQQPCQRIEASAVPPTEAPAAREAAAKQPIFRRSRRLGKASRPEDDEDTNLDHLEVASRGLHGASRTMSMSGTSYSSNSLPAKRLWQIFIATLPRVSERVRRAPFIVKLQAFLKLSFEQWESDDTSFEEAAEDLPQMMDTEPGAEPHHIASTITVGGGVPPAAAAAIAASGSAAGSKLPRLSSRSTSTSFITLPHAATMLTRHAVGAAGAVAAAFGSAFGGGKGLIVDVNMPATVGNVANLLLVSTIHPNSMFKVMWDFLYLPVNTWICMVTPVLVVFVANLRLVTNLGRVEFSMDVLCFLDVLMHLRTAVIRGDFHVQTSFKAIAGRYFRGLGWLDLAACVPFLTLINIGPANDFSTKVLLFRLLRLTKMLRMPQVLKSSNVQTYLSYKVFKRKDLVALVVLLAAVLTTMHHLACYFYFLGVVATHNTMTGPPDGKSDSWVESEQLVDINYPGRYIISLYWAMYTFLTVGYGDIVIVTVAERIWAIVTAITGVVMAGWFMGAVAAYMGGTGGAEAEMQQMRQDVYQFIQKRRLRGSVANRVQRYQDEVRWRQLTEHDREVINGLPRMLRSEVVLHLFENVVSKVRFMRTRPPQFVVELLLRLQLRLYDKEDYIVREGEIGGEVYFLSEGQLQIRREVLSDDTDQRPSDGAAASPGPAKGGRIIRLGIRALNYFSKSLSHGSRLGPGAAARAAAGGGGGGGGSTSPVGGRPTTPLQTDCAVACGDAATSGGEALSPLLVSPVAPASPRSPAAQSGRSQPWNLLRPPSRFFLKYMESRGGNTTMPHAPPQPDAATVAAAGRPSSPSQEGGGGQVATVMAGATATAAAAPAPGPAALSSPLRGMDGGLVAASTGATVTGGGGGGWGGRGGGGGSRPPPLFVPSTSVAVSVGGGRRGWAAAAPGLTGTTTSTTPTPISAATAATGGGGGGDAAAVAAKGGGDDNNNGNGNATGRGGLLWHMLGRVPQPLHKPNHSSKPPARLGSHRVLATIQPGGHFGFVSCTTGEPRLNSVVASTPRCEVLVLAKKDLEELMQDWPDIFDDPDLQPSLPSTRRHSACLYDITPPSAPGGPDHATGTGAPSDPPVPFPFPFHAAPTTTASIHLHEAQASDASSALLKSHTLPYHSRTPSHAASPVIPLSNGLGVGYGTYGVSGGGGGGGGGGGYTPCPNLFRVSEAESSSFLERPRPEVIPGVSSELRRVAEHSGGMQEAEADGKGEEKQEEEAAGGKREEKEEEEGEGQGPKRLSAPGCSGEGAAGDPAGGGLAEDEVLGEGKAGLDAGDGHSEQGPAAGSAGRRSGAGTVPAAPEKAPWEAGAAVGGRTQRPGSQPSVAIEMQAL